MNHWPLCMIYLDFCYLKNYIYLFIIMGEAHSMLYLWKSKDKLWESVLFFGCVYPGTSGLGHHFTSPILLIYALPHSLNHTESGFRITMFAGLSVLDTLVSPFARHSVRLGTWSIRHSLCFWWSGVGTLVSRRFSSKKSDQGFQKIIGTPWRKVSSNQECGGTLPGRDGT